MENVITAKGKNGEKMQQHPFEGSCSQQLCDTTVHRAEMGGMPRNKTHNLRGPGSSVWFDMTFSALLQSSAA